MGLFGKLFGSTKPSEKTFNALDYKGFTITPTPFKATSGWQLAGTISKGVQSHKFIRADQFGTPDEAAEFAIVKGKLIVDQSGDDIFR